MCLVPEEVRALVSPKLYLIFTHTVFNFRSYAKGFFLLKIRLLVKNSTCTLCKTSLDQYDYNHNCSGIFMFLFFMLTAYIC